MRRAVVLILAAIALAGCGHPFIPASALGGKSPGGSHTAASRSAASRAAALSRLLHRLGPTRLGVDLYAATGYPLGTVQRYGAADVRYLRHVLDAQSVGLVWNLTDRSFRSDTVRVSEQESLSPQSVATITRLAQAAGMTVQYRPIIRVGPPSGWNIAKRSWEGHIRPASQRAWFASLFQAELPYLRIAQRLGVSEVVTGTELDGVGGSSWWPSFLRKARSVYHGTLSYSAVMEQYYAPRRRLPPVSQLGLDAYPTVDLPDSASQRAVTRDWEQVIGRAPRQLLARTAMDEVSIAALAGAYKSPAAWNARGRTDLRVQARWFTAACQTAVHFHMRAVYFYEVRFSSDPAQRSAFPPFFQGKPGAIAIRDCRAIFRG